jgi:hypothetical protein
MCCSTGFLMGMCPTQAEEIHLSKSVYEDKVYASWLGQCVGNIYGLPHENQYIDQPGPETFPYGYGPMQEELRQANGVFSDDDTDLEYMDLLAMEKFGPEPTLEELAGMWKHHIRRKIWIANRAALAAMRFGFTPPVTGFKTVNPHWFQIDPQLINEIWAVISPGMVTYAVQRSLAGAEITNCDWGTEPTMHYGAMYAAAFFEKDVNKLIDLGASALPKGSRYVATIEDMKRFHAQWPDDWKKAREAMARKYYHEEPAATKTIWNANLNGACGILALLYGNGDFQKTLDMACAMGFDADNQAATVSGLLAIIHGTQGIPKELLFPFPDLNWKEPFNDFYKNLSREDMPDASLKDISQRTANQGEKVILSHGGKKITENGEEVFVIQTDASYQPRIELPGQPGPYLEVGKQASFSFVVWPSSPTPKWTLAKGEIPKGLAFKDGELSGTPLQPGQCEITLEVTDGKSSTTRAFPLVVRPTNLAPSATKVLSRVSQVDPKQFEQFDLTGPLVLLADSVEVIRDGKTSGEGSTFNSLALGRVEEKDYYGYEWNSPQRIGLIGFHTGTMESDGGWFLSLNAEYQSSDGSWKPVEGLSIEPPLVPGRNPEDKPHWVEYLLSFKPVETRAIRIIGDRKDQREGDEKRGWSSITELTVHGPLGE